MDGKPASGARLKERSNPADAPAGGRELASLTIGELARAAGVTVRALRFYQSKGLLSPKRTGTARSFSCGDRDRLLLILQGKRLGFTLMEIRHMLASCGDAAALPIGRKTCVEQIRLLERQRRDIEQALAELRRIYTDMFVSESQATPPEAA